MERAGTPEVQIDRWSGDRPPTESEVYALLGQRVEPQRWSNGPGDIYAAHSHGYRKLLAVVRGSIRFQLPDAGQDVELHHGDRMTLPPGVRHAAIVGQEGVVCIEAHVSERSARAR